MFRPKTPTETVSITFDFADDLGAGETITGSTWSITVKQGTDPAVGSMLTGVATINGTLVSYLVQNGVADTLYCIKCQAQTSGGQRPEAFDQMWVRTSCR